MTQWCRILDAAAHLSDVKTACSEPEHLSEERGDCKQEYDQCSRRSFETEFLSAAVDNNTHYDSILQQGAWMWKAAKHIAINEMECERDLVCIAVVHVFGPCAVDSSSNVRKTSASPA